MSWHEHGRPSPNLDDQRTNVEKPKKQSVAPGNVAKVGALAFALGFLGWCAPQLVLTPQAPVTAPSDYEGRFVANVLGNNEDWARSTLGDKYRTAKLTLYTKSLATKDCGGVKAAFGPFYCPEGERIFLDTAFFKEIETPSCKKLGPACEFARAQVIAHEHGHHVQKVFGIFDIDRGVMSRNQINVRTELQADCISGLWAGWANSMYKNITPEMVKAAQEITQDGGDGPRGPPSHGTAEQRSRWFMKGYAGKSLDSCDTFKGEL